MEMKTKKTFAILLTFMILLALLPNFVPFAAANGEEVAITSLMIASEIENSIQNAVDNSFSGDIITVTGNKMNENAVIDLNIPADITVVWKALSNDLSFNIQGGGTFEVAAGGKIEVTGKNAVTVDTGNVVVSGGEVILKTNGHVSQFLAAVYVTNGNVAVSDGKVLALRTDINDWWHVSAIRVINGDVTVTGGTVSAYRNSSTIYLDAGSIAVSGGEVSSIGETTAENGIPTNNCYALRIDYDGTITITGGIVSADGAVTYNDAINIGRGLAAYYSGTCIGDFFVEYQNDGIVVEVDSLAIPKEYHETVNGLTRMEGGDLSNAEWDTSGTAPHINFENGSYSYSVPWIGIVNSPPVEFPVRLAETGDLFKMLSEGIEAANNLGLDTFTLEVIGDVTETGDVIILSENVTIVGAEGKHTVTMIPVQPYTGKIEVEGGGSLTLGDETTANTLTILHAVRVTDGTIDAKDGIILKSSGNAALQLNGSNAGGVISGGRFEANGASGVALDIDRGAQLSEISGGTFVGRIDAMHLSGAGTRVELVSGGEFYQTDPDVTLHGHAVFVQNEAQIGEISGGHFEAIRNNALVVIRGGWIDEISGGMFVAHRFGVLSNEQGEDTRNAAIWIQSEKNAKTGIGTISGGEIKGTNFGVLVINYHDGSSNARIDKITGGTFEGTVALQNDLGCNVDEIVGGKFTGSQGIFNVGTIGLIGGDADIRGTSSYGIFNYRTTQAGQIDEIRGGKIVSDADYAIANWGNISLISGGTIIGQRSAINNDGLNKGRLDVITGGVFWGKTGPAINLAYELELEPNLNAFKGEGRYQGSGGVVFNNEALVIYPGTAPDIYFMSTKTESVTGIQDVQFKYLTLGITAEVIFDSNGGNFADGSTSKTRVLDAGDFLGTDMPDDPTWTGYIFQGWNTEQDGTGSEFTGSTVVTNDIIVYARWTPQPVDYEVTVKESYAAINGTGTYTEGTIATIHAGSRNGYTFTGWTVDAGTVTLADAGNETTSFTMPSENVTVTAHWNSGGGGNGGGGTGTATIINPKNPEIEKPHTPEEPEPKSTESESIVIILFYIWTVVGFIYNRNRENEIKKDDMQQ